METYVVLQDGHASPPERRRGRMGAAFRAVAAASVTAMLMVGLLPSTDVVRVQQALAISATHSGGAADVHAPAA